MAWPIASILLLIAQGNAPAPAPAEKPAVVAPAAGATKDAAGAPAKNAANAPAAPSGAEGSSFGMLFTLGPIVVLFYLLIIRPQRAQESKHKLLLAGLKKNDKVQTSGGILGTVVSADAASDKVVVRVDDDKGIKLTFLKASIVRVIDPQAEKDKAAGSAPVE